MRHPQPYVYALAACLVLLQAADFFLTWLLLASGLRGDVYEANPLALRILREYGWFGLAVFKGGCSLIAMTACLVVSRSRPAAALRLLGVLCLVMGGVVGYSGALVAAPSESPEQEVGRLELRASELSISIAKMAHFSHHREQICRKVLENRIDLPTAVAELQKCISAHEGMFLTGRNSLPDLGDGAQLAAYLYHHSTRLITLDAKLLPGLESLTESMVRSYPTAPRIDAKEVTKGLVPCWRRGLITATAYLASPQG